MNAAVVTRAGIALWEVVFALHIERGIVHVAQRTAGQLGPRHFLAQQPGIRSVRDGRRIASSRATGRQPRLRTRAEDIAHALV